MPSRCSSAWPRHAEASHSSSVGGGALVQGPLRLAVGVALDAAVDRVGRVTVDSRQLQGAAVHPDAVAVPVVEADRAIGDDGVEQAPVRGPAREGGHRPAASDDPGPLRVGHGVLPDARHVLGRDDGAAVQVAAQAVQAGRDGMHVGVLEARQERAATQFHDPGAGADVLPDVRVRPHSDDAAATHGHGLRPRTSGIDGVDGASAQEEVGGS
jgi:hypothetical protein